MRDLAGRSGGSEGAARGRARLWWLAATAAFVLGFGVVAFHLRSGRQTEPAASAGAFGEASAGANLVICVIDAARADHVGCYGYARDTTPYLDQLAQESVLFESHFSQATSTKPSTASLLTGQYPDTHLTFLMRAMPDSARTLERALEEAGFRTACFSSNIVASPLSGLCHDFGETYYRPHLARHVAPQEDTVRPEPLLEMVEEWLAKKAEGRFFAYIHLVPPHYPYNAPEEMKALWADEHTPNFRPEDAGPPRTIERRTPGHGFLLPEWINLYDANLRYADWAVSELVRLLRDRGILEKTVLVVTSDHGEALGERGYVWHGTSVYPETTHIPLLVRFPGGFAGGRRISALTQTIDVMPTMLHVLGTPGAGKEIQGQSLVPLLTGETDRLHDYVFARTFGDEAQYMMQGTEWALLLLRGGRGRVLYDLEADPGQTRNAAPYESQRLYAMLGAFQEHAEQQRVPPVQFVNPHTKQPRLPAAREVETTDRDRRQLRALGYLR